MKEKMLVKEVITKTLIYSDGSIKTDVEEICHVREIHMQFKAEREVEREEFVKLYRKAKSMKGLSEELGMTMQELEDEMIRLGVTLNDKYGLTDKEIIDLYVNDKMSVQKISTTHNIPIMRIKNVLFTNKIEINDPTLGLRITDEHDEELIKLYNEGMKKSDIARTVGMSYSKTCRRLKMLGCGVVDISKATEKELYIINAFRECKTIANTHRKTGMAKVGVENILLKYGIPFGYMAKGN